MSGNSKQMLPCCILGACLRASLGQCGPSLALLQHMYYADFTWYDLPAVNSLEKFSVHQLEITLLMIRFPCPIFVFLLSEWREMNLSCWHEDNTEGQALIFTFSQMC